MSTATRGHCPDALAYEVYRLTHAALHQRFRRPSASKTAVPEAVGAAYVRWLGNPSDKTKHAAAEHAYWLAKTATVFILGGPANLEKRGRAIRCIAGFSAQGDGMRSDDADPNEAIYRAHYEVAALDGHEDNLIEAMDAVEAERHRPPTPPPITLADALIALKRLDWTDRAIAQALGVARSTVASWRIRRFAPPEASIAAVIALAWRGTPPPPGGKKPPDKVKRRSVDSLR
jgi:hypothetical protein